MEKVIETAFEGQCAMQDILLKRTVAMPDDVRDKLVELIRPGVNSAKACAEAAELVYARREELEPELIEFGAQLAAMCAEFGFHGLAVDDRGYAMSATMRKMDGVASKAPPASRLTAPNARLDLAPAGDAVAPVPPPVAGQIEASELPEELERSLMP